VASLEADAASAALEEASRLATTSDDLGFAPAEAPRSPDVTNLEADAALATLEAPATEPSTAGLPRWIAAARQAAAPILDGLVAALDRWFAASETASARPARDEARAAESVDPAELGLRGFL
jgi:hypothetical protein